MDINVRTHQAYQGSTMKVKRYRPKQMSIIKDINEQAGSQEDVATNLQHELLECTSYCKVKIYNNTEKTPTTANGGYVTIGHTDYRGLATYWF